MYHRRSVVEGLLHHRGEAIAGRMTETGQGGVAEIADLMLLQVVNRLEPFVAHLTAMKGLHPEELYRYLLQIAGELATFTTSSRRPAELPVYRHDDLYRQYHGFCKITGVNERCSDYLFRTKNSEFYYTFCDFGLDHSVYY